MRDRQTLAVRFSTELRLQHRQLQGLLQLWKSKQVEDELPNRAEFDAATLKHFLPHVSIVEYDLSCSRYRFRLIGTAVADRYGYNATGKYLDEVYADADLAAVQAGFNMVRLKCKPLAMQGTLSRPDHADLALESLLLPLAVPTGSNPQILAATYFRFSEDVAVSREAAPSRYSIIF